MIVNNQLIDHVQHLYTCQSLFRDHYVYAPSQWEFALHCNDISHWLGADTEWSLLLTRYMLSFTCEDHSLYAPSQWEMVLHSNAVSHWLAAYTEWSLYLWGNINLYLYSISFLHSENWNVNFTSKISWLCLKLNHVSKRPPGRWWVNTKKHLVLNLR